MKNKPEDNVRRNLEALIKKYGVTRKGGHYEGRYWVEDKDGKTNPLHQIKSVSTAT